MRRTCLLDGFARRVAQAQDNRITRRILVSTRRIHQNHDANTNDGHQRMGRRRVVITGLGAITPLGPDVESTWKAVLQTKDEEVQSGRGSPQHGITDLYTALQQQNLSPAQFEKEWEMLQSLSCQVAASIPYDWIYNHPLHNEEDNPPTWTDGRTARFVQLALIAAREAMYNSGLNDWLSLCNTQQQSESNEANNLMEDGRPIFGVSVGNGMSSTRDISMASSIKSLRRLSPHFVPQILPNSPAARIAIHHNLTGPNLSHSEACAAGAAAIAQAVELIQSGRVQGMVAGGCESAVEMLGLAGFSRLRALSTGIGAGSDAHEGESNANAAVQSSSRPFDSQRNGFVLAEGAAMLVLEEYNHAISRGAPILAEVLGVGYSGDAFHITAPEPSGKGAARAMLHAVNDAGINMNDVDYVNSHATSTPIGDVAEMNAVQLALSQTKNVHADGNDVTALPLLVSSTKGATGHLLGAAGAIEAALTVKSVSENTAPHTRNLEDVSEDISNVLQPNDIEDEKSQRSIHLVQKEPLSQPIKAAISNSFGFGGTNVSILFGKVS